MPNFFLTFFYHCYQQIDAPGAETRAVFGFDQSTADVNTFCSPLQEVFSPNVDIGIGGGQTMPREFARNTGLSVYLNMVPGKMVLKLQEAIYLKTVGTTS